MLEEKKPYLEGYEINRANMCIAGIYDNIRAIEVEMLTVKTPYKHYLMEKLEKIQIDINCLRSMCETEDKEV